MGCHYGSSTQEETVGAKNLTKEELELNCLWGWEVSFLKGLIFRFADNSYFAWKPPAEKHLSWSTAKFSNLKALTYYWGTWHSCECTTEVRESCLVTHLSMTDKEKLHKTVQVYKTGRLISIKWSKTWWQFKIHPLQKQNLQEISQ